MAREVLVRIWCDACLEVENAKRDGTDHVLAVDGAAPRTLALCPEHAQNLLDPLAALLQARGAPVQAPPARRKPAKAAQAAAQTSPVVPPASSATPAEGQAQLALGDADPAGPYPCPYCSVPLVNSNSMGAHLYARHHSNLGDTYGATCPLCGLESSSHGLRTHAKVAHGAPSLPGLFVMAEAAEDPAGVVAARRAVLAARAAA